MSEKFQRRTPPKCRSYVKYPDPAHPRANGQHPWRTADLCRAYGVPPGRSPGGGVIGILELGGGWHQSDLDRFSQLNGLPRIAVTDVSMDGATNSPGDDADGEVALDIQVAVAAYFFATGRMPTVRVYWAGNTVDAFAATIARAVADGCDVLSISWGTAENNLDAATVQACERAAAQAAAVGMVVTAAAGDNSASDGTGGVTVDFPSCCPSVVACGGTMKTDSAESAWGGGGTQGSGTGGGFSRIFAKPGYQSIGPANPGRMVPDVSANADPNTGWLIVLNGQEMPIGGTSAVAPFYAGLYAAFGRKLGAANPKQWANASAFADITSGSNGWKAIAGPDACTGLGVPTGKLPAVFADVAPPPPLPPNPPQPPAPPVNPTTFTFTGTATFSGALVPNAAVTADGGLVADLPHVVVGCSDLPIYGHSTGGGLCEPKDDVAPRLSVSDVTTWLQHLAQEYGADTTAAVDALTKFAAYPTADNFVALVAAVQKIKADATATSTAQFHARIDWSGLFAAVEATISAVVQLINSVKGG